MVREVSRKKLYFLTLIICMIFMLSSCRAVSIAGVENFSQFDSNVSLTRVILPSEDFIDRFDYAEGIYHYFDNCLYTSNRMEKAIVVLEYDSETYLLAKQYCMDNMTLASEEVAYNGYVFAENLGFPQKYGTMENGQNPRFPYRMNMFGFNDDRSTLVFLGLFCNENWYEKADLIQTDFGAFLKTFYSEYYSFE